MPCATTRACVQGAVVKLNAAAVLREDALFKKKQEKEAAIIKARTRARAPVAAFACPAGVCDVPRCGAHARGAGVRERPARRERVPAVADGGEEGGRGGAQGTAGTGGRRAPVSRACVNTVVPRARAGSD